MKEIGLLACIAFIAVIPAVLIFRVNEELDTEKAEENKDKFLLSVPSNQFKMDDSSRSFESSISSIVQY